MTTPELVAVDYSMPVSTIVQRLEANENQLRAAIARLPWYSMRRRWMLTGAVSVLRIERDALLDISSSYQPFWHQMGITLRANPAPDRWVGQKNDRN
jgi:hypothetical protein